MQSISFLMISGHSKQSQAHAPLFNIVLPLDQPPQEKAFIVVFSKSLCLPTCTQQAVKLAHAPEMRRVSKSSMMPMPSGLLMEFRSHLLSESELLVLR
jgi:hypothetical protein